MKRASVLFVQLLWCAASVFSDSVPDEPLDVYVCAGQSNMVGVRSDRSKLPPELQAAQPDVLVFDGTQWNVMSPPDTGFGPEISFAYEMQKAVGHRIGIIKHSVGGTSLAVQWDPSKKSGTLYAELKQKVEAAMQSRPIAVKGMIWMQGERDSKTELYASAYKANLENLIKQVRKDFKNPGLAFVAGRVNPLIKAFPYVETVREAQSTCQADHYAFVDCDDLPKQSDRLHYTTPGLVELGKRMAATTAGLINP